MMDVYVVIAENDREHKMPSGKVFKDDGGPLIFEQYVFSASLEKIKERARQLSMQYGKCRVAKVAPTSFVYDDGEELK